MASNKSSLSSRVRLIDDDGHNKGEMLVSEAYRLAEAAGLDLVEIGKQEGLSVCRIMDEGKWLYEKKKKQKQRKKKSQAQARSKSLKEIKFHANIAQHDFETKIKHIKKFVEKGHPVHVVVQLRGREKMVPSQGNDKLKEVLALLDGIVRHYDIQQTNGKTMMIHTTVYPLTKKAENERETGNYHIFGGSQEIS